HGAVGAPTMVAPSAGALTVGARVRARLPLVPRQSLRGLPDVTVRAVHPDRVHLDRTRTTERGGLLALRQGGGTVHARLGPVDGHPTPTTVSRPVLAVDTEEPLQVDRARSNGFYWRGPRRRPTAWPPTRSRSSPLSVTCRPGWCAPPRSTAPRPGTRTPGRS